MLFITLQKCGWDSKKKGQEFEGVGGRNRTARKMGDFCSGERDGGNSASVSISRAQESNEWRANAKALLVPHSPSLL